MPTKLVAISVLVFIAADCGSQPVPAAKQVVVWHAMGSWSGRGNAQTESFNSETGSLRVRWQTNNEASADAVAFRLTAHSAISGRPLQVAVDYHGVGRGTAYIAEDPRVFYIVVESANIDWSFTVEEGVMGTLTEMSHK